MTSRARRPSQRDTTEGSPLTDPRDYFAAKEAWEREHPGEVYTTAMHHSSGARPRVLTDYWTQFDEAAPLAL